MTVDDLALYLFKYNREKGLGKTFIIPDNKFILDFTDQIFTAKLGAKIEFNLMRSDTYTRPDGKTGNEQIDDAIITEIEQFIEKFYKNERDKKLAPHAATAIFRDMLTQIKSEKLQAALAVGAGAGEPMATEAALNALAVRVGDVEAKANTIERNLTDLTGKVNGIELVVTRHTGEILDLRNALGVLRREFDTDHGMLLRHDAAIVPGAAAAAVDHNNILRTKAILNQLDQYVFNAIRNTQGGTAHKPEDLGFPKNDLPDI